MHGDASFLTSFWIPGVVSCRSAAKLFLLSRNEEEFLKFRSVMRRAEVLWGRKTALSKKQRVRRIFHSKTRLNTSKHATAHH
jgi:hypothetical protein